MATVEAALERRLPTLAICFGAQLLADLLGGEVVRDFDSRERGTYDLTRTADAAGDPLFAHLPVTFAAQCSHQDRITSLPDGATVLAESSLCPVQAFVLPDGVYAVQFHPERSRADFQLQYEAKVADYAAQGKKVNMLSPLRESPEAESIVRRFAELYLR
ncbi:type 1 glutamine amidotransferase [Patescibacteria group bacterium]